MKELSSSFTIAAARALDAETADWNLERALETALAVCYARAFTQSTLLKLDRREYEPQDPQLAYVHGVLCALRDKVHAHTDKASGRSAWLSVDSPVELPGRIGFIHQEWDPFPRALLPKALELFRMRREKFHDEAGRIQIFLHGPDGLAR